VLTGVEPAGVEPAGVEPAGVEPAGTPLSGAAGAVAVAEAVTDPAAIRWCSWAGLLLHH
jgi:hypothetical protein